MLGRKVGLTEAQGEARVPRSHVSSCLVMELRTGSLEWRAGSPFVWTQRLTRHCAVGDKIESLILGKVGEKVGSLTGSRACHTQAA